MRRGIVAWMLLPILYGVPAYAKRVALVVGNDGYQYVEKLQNARADALAIAAALRQAGFEVTLKQDVTLSTFKAALREFKANIGGGDEAVFYFSGHGVQFDGTNYLLPVDIINQSEEQMIDDAVPLQRVLEDLSVQKARFSLAIVDACRSNPFKGMGRSLERRGLAPVTAASGQMVLYSAGAGQEALDFLGPGDRDPNGVFTRVLLREMQEPGESVDRVLHNVRDEVVRLAKSVGHEQVPALYDQSIGEFYFRPGSASAGPVQRPNVTAAPAVGETAAAADDSYWNRIKDGKDLASFEAYLDRFPTARHTDEARAILGGIWVVDPSTGCRAWDANRNPTPGLALSWSGKCVEGRAEGDGTWVWTTEAYRWVLTGTMRAGRITGNYAGTVYKDGTPDFKVEGKSSHSTRGTTDWQRISYLRPEEGPVSSRETTRINGIYEGDYVEVFRTGQTRHETMIHGKKNGHATITGPGSFRYDGDMVDGEWTGHASIKYTDGSTYAGDVVKGKPSGIGKMTYPNGNTYEGAYVSGVRDGFGKFSSKDGYYEGDFRHDEWEGRGVLVAANGDRYVGELSHSKFHGRGVLTKKDGRRFEGQFIAGEFSGH